MKWIIQDGAGNRMFDDQEFNSFSEGWQYVYAQLPHSDDLWPEIYLVPIHLADPGLGQSERKGFAQPFDFGGTTTNRRGANGSK